MSFRRGLVILSPRSRCHLVYYRCHQLPCSCVVLAKTFLDLFLSNDTSLGNFSSSKTDTAKELASSWVSRCFNPRRNVIQPSDIVCNIGTVPAQHPSVCFCSI